MPTSFPERAASDNPQTGYLVVQRNLDFLKDVLDGKFNNHIIVTGSRGGNAALTSLLSGLAALGIITDSTTP